ncbi:MAG: ABC transporter permease [Candidatus Longimicrobiales bacterium M2_2A_002]
MEPTRFDVLIHDVRYGLRQLARNPVFTGVAVLTLALGIGANTAIFSVVDGILFRPLPFPEPHELVNVWTDVSERGGPEDEWLSYANYWSLKQQSDRLESLAAWGGARPTLMGGGEAEQLVGARVDPDMFSDVLQVTPALGRDFRRDDDAPNASPVAVLSHGFWQRAYGGDLAIVGETIDLNGAATEVIGVMPARFRPPFVPDADLWLTPRLPLDQREQGRGNYSWRAVGRLADGVTVASADAELELLGQRLEAEYPESNLDMSFAAASVRDDLVGEARAGLLVLLAAVGFVLLVACVNVANLLLARAAARRGELAVRSAMGAGRGRIVRQLLTESGLLALAGGLAGVAVAVWGTDLLVALAPPGTPRIDEVAVDGRVLAVTAAVTVLAGALFGLVPAIRAAREDAFDALREGGRGSGAGKRANRTQAALVVGQVALALVLLVGAGLLVRSFDNLRTHDLGFDPDGLLTMQVNLFGPDYQDGDVRRSFYDALHTRLAAIPGVEEVAFTSTVPLTGFDGDADFNIEGRAVPDPETPQAAWVRRATPNYFKTMEMRLLAGRAFTPADDANAPQVVVINETFANRHFPGENPVGKRIDFGDRSDVSWREIVGVVGDIKNFGIRADSRVAVYLPYEQATAPFVFPVLRTAVPTETLVPSVRRAVAELDPTLAVGRVATMESLVRDAIASDRFVASLLSLFAVVALLLAVVGLYGVVAYSVGRRLPELGVRMALGAAGSEITRMIVRQAMILVGTGVAVGLVVAGVLSRFVEGLLFGVPALDPVTFGAVAAALALAGSLAAAVPARRAGKVDPVRVLDAE